MRTKTVQNCGSMKHSIRFRLSIDSMAALFNAHAHNMHHDLGTGTLQPFNDNPHVHTTILKAHCSVIVSTGALEG